jgi:hypothetical protein
VPNGLLTSGGGLPKIGTYATTYLKGDAVEFTEEAIRKLARGRASEIVGEALGLHLPRPVAGLAESLRDALREIESRLRGGYLDVLVRGRLSPYWRELVIRADEFLPRPCAGCGAPVWPGTRFGTPVFRCDDCWRALVIGARLVARAETPAEIQAGLRMVWPRLD